MNKEAAKLDPQSILYHIEAAGVQHLLQRYDEAVAAYDEALAILEPDDPQRKNILEMCRISEEQAQKIPSRTVDRTDTITDVLTENHLQDEEIANTQTIIAEESLLTETTLQKTSDDSGARFLDDFTALNIARQIYGFTYEPEPQFIALNSKEISSLHKNFIEKTKTIKCFEM